MRRIEILLRLALGALFAVCAVGAFSRSDWPGTALFLFLAVLWVWRANRI